MTTEIMSIADASAPPRKRARRASAQGKSPLTDRRLFAPFRALGLVTNHVPFVLQTRSHKGATDGPRIHILTCLGRSWSLWEGNNMTLLFVGTEAPEPISCLAMDGDAVWASSGLHVLKYIRGKEVLRVTNPLETSLACISIFGSVLLALDDEGRRLIMWDTTTGEFSSYIEFDPGFTASYILHPSTYLNKILVASSQGTMQLWNIQTRTRIYKFMLQKLASHQSTLQESQRAITALVQGPAIDVVGVGFQSGEISVYDIRTDEQLMSMSMDDGSIRALGFRNDGHPILASASSSGNLALWDLNEGGHLLHLVRGAHDGSIAALEWVHGQPVLITSGVDNSVKQWLFDSPTSPPRLLKYRSGHQAPPHLIRYYGEDGKQLLTASQDRSLRCTSVVRDSRSFELSQGSLMKKAISLSVPVASLKFPPITSISYSSARAKDWDDIVTGHVDETFARTWTMLNKKVGKYAFGLAAGAVKAVCVTACGNFAIAASSTGVIHMWNMQSGMRRRTFDLGPCPPSVASPTRDKKIRCVTGLASDSLNTVLIATTLDGTVNFFDFHTAKLEHTVVLPSATVALSFQRQSGLLAIVCDDLCIRVLDVETRKVVRELTGFKGRILDITFSSDSRWLISTSLDSVVRTFDLPSGRLIDAFRTSSVATSVSFSPTNDFLATAHVDSVGVYLWANRAQYADVAFHGIKEEEIVDVSLPSMQGDLEDDALDALSALTVQDAETNVFSTPIQLGDDLITLTLLPRTRWQTLLNLDVIRQRNKPKEPPKAPERAPFFLPTLPGVEQRFAAPAEKQKSVVEKKGRRLEQAAAQSESLFQQTLMECEVESDYEPVFACAKKLSPAALDLELRSLVSLDSMQRLLHALACRLKSHKDFEVVQALQKVFLRMHGEIIIDNPELQQSVAILLDVQKAETERILDLVSSSLGTLGFIRD
ncbi:Utp21-domain-containing protein [Fistulina hepatica ATCC 64428]|nr:Utp21-domain-containing protein [Fistulina hepatica ATCC 64428]